MSITRILSWIHRKTNHLFLPLCSLVALLGRLLQQTYVDLTIHPDERRKACYFSMAAQTTEKSLSDVGSPFFLSLSLSLGRVLEVEQKEILERMRAQHQAVADRAEAQSKQA